MILNSKIEKIAQDMNIRPYSPSSDYKIAQKWWLTYNSAHLEHHFLPNTGAVVEKDGVPVAMGWVYFSNAPIAQLSWVVSDPKLGPKARFLAVSMVIDMCTHMAKNNGYKMIQMFSDRPGLSKMANELGFNNIRQHDFLVKYIYEEGDDDV